MTFISDAHWTGLQTALFVLTFVICGWIPVLFTLTARRDNGYATLWDRASGTRVVTRATGATRPALEMAALMEDPPENAESLGPYRRTREIVPGHWILGMDPVLRRPVWLLKRQGLDPSPARRTVGRPGRPRWLQSVRLGKEEVWDVYEATPGVPLTQLLAAKQQLPWATARHWLHDLASELWAAARDRTLPAGLSLDHVWISARNRALLLDRPWPVTHTADPVVAVGDLAGQQRFLGTVAARVDATTLPLHARPVLQSLQAGRFEKLSFLTGTLRGLLDKPADVGRAIRAGSILMLPFYGWIALFIGRYHDKPWSEHLFGILVLSPLMILAAIALIQLLALPFRTTASHWIFRLAVVDRSGARAGRPRLFARWAAVWLPLFVPVSLVLGLGSNAGTASLFPALAVLLLWLSASMVAVRHPHRGLHDRLAGTWVVRC